MYATGSGVAKNHDLARKWLSKASDQGVANAQLVFDIYYPDHVNGPRLEPGVKPHLLTLLEVLAKEERSSSMHNRHERRARRRGRQRNF